MVIKVTESGNPSSASTIGEHFEKYHLLPAELITNWEDVIDNIKVLKLKKQAEQNLFLIGIEYPADTPIMVDEGGVGYDRDKAKEE